MNTPALLILICQAIHLVVATHAAGSQFPRRSRAFLQQASAPQQSLAISREVSTTNLRVSFFHDSAAALSGLSTTLPDILDEDGFTTCTQGAPAVCVKKVGADCQPFSSTTYLYTGCSAQCSDIYIQWIGINDAKIDNGNAMNLESDLLDWKREVRSKCGAHTGLVFVMPPVFKKGGFSEWTDDVPALRATLAAAYRSATLGDLRAVLVDGQALAQASDFDDQIHFCRGAVPCVTSQNIGGAVYNAVTHLSTIHANPMFVAVNPFAERLERKLENKRLEELRKSKEARYNWTNVTRGALLVGMSAAPLALAEGGSLLFQRSSAVLDSPTSRPWLALFDLVRLLGAGHICAFHFFQRVSAVAGYGKYWISVFFFMSGFLAMYREERHSVFSLVTRNIQASCVVYAAALVATATVVWPTALVAAQTFSMTQAWIFPCHNDFNGPAWFISALLLFWILTPHWSTLLDRRTSAQLLLMMGFCWLATLTPFVSCVVLGMNPNVEFGNFIEFHPLGRWPVYVGGMAFAQWWLSMSTESRNSLGASASSAGVVLLGLVGVGFTTPPGFNLTLTSLLWDHGFATFPMLCSLSCLATQWKPPASCATLLAWAGRVTLPVYLLHVPVMLMGKYYLGSFPPVFFWCALLVASIATAAMQSAATSMARRYFDTPAENLK